MDSTFLELAAKRYSVRKYKGDPVSRDMIDRCIEAARLAPSACNSQPWKFVVIDDPQLKDTLAKTAFKGLTDFNHFAFKAPVLVLIVSQRQKMFARVAGIVKRKDFSLMDIGITAEHFCLQAAHEGLGTCMLGWFNEKTVKKMLSIPKQKRVELIISLGFADDPAVPDKTRKPTKEMSTYNKYQ